MPETVQKTKVNCVRLVAWPKLAIYATYLAANTLKWLQCLATRETVQVRNSILPYCTVSVRPQPTGSIFPNSLVSFAVVNGSVAADRPPVIVAVVRGTETIAEPFALRLR